VSLFDSCSCHLKTAVGLYPLEGIYRRGAARRFVPLLEARIAAVQGALPEDWTVDDTAQVEPMPFRAEAAQGESRTALLALLSCSAFLGDALLSWLVRDPLRSAPRRSP
jgi:hypothetical protein